MTDVFVVFQPTCWCPSGMGTNMASAYKSCNILHQKNFCDPNLGESLCIVTFFLFSGSGLVSLTVALSTVPSYANLIYFELRDTENQFVMFRLVRLPIIDVHVSGADPGLVRRGCTTKEWRN